MFDPLSPPGSARHKPFTKRVADERRRFPFLLARSGGCFQNHPISNTGTEHDRRFHELLQNTARMSYIYPARLLWLQQGCR